MNKLAVTGAILVFTICFLLAVPLTGQADELKKLHNQYKQLMKKGQYRQAVETAKRAKDLAERTHGANSTQFALWLNELARAYNSSGRYSEAEGFFRQALKIGDKKLGPNHPDVATVLNNLAILYVPQGRYSEAEPLFKRSLKIWEKKFGPNHPDVATGLNNLAMLYHAQGRYSEAEPLFKRSLKIREQKLGPNHPDVAAGLGNLAELYTSQGRYSEAEPLYQTSLKIWEKKLGPNHPDVALGLNNLATHYFAHGRYSEAESLYQRSLKIWEKKLGPNHPHVATGLNLLAELYTSQGRYSEAERLSKRSLKIWEKKFGPNHWFVAIFLSDLANLYLDQGSTFTAKQLIQKLEALRMRGSCMGRWYLLESQYAKAMRYYLWLLSRAEKSRDANDLFLAYTGLGKAYEAQEDYKKAAEHYTKAVKLVEEMRSSLQPTQRKNFLGVRIGGFYRSEPAKGLTRVRMKLNQASGSIESSEMTRARAFADKMAETSSLGATGVPKRVLEKEQHLVQRVAALKQTRSKEPKGKNPERYNNLTKEIEKAEKELKAFIEMLWNKHKAYASVKYPRPVKLKDSAAQHDEHFVVFDVVGEGIGVKLIKGKKIVETYYKDYKIKDLETQVRKFRESFEKYQLKSFNPELGKKLYKLLLQRVLLDVPKETPLVIVPDGILATLPFEALVVDGKAKWQDGKMGPFPTGITYLGDVYPISYYQSITAMTLARTLGKKAQKNNNMIVVADPVFNMADGRSRGQKASNSKLASANSDLYKNLMVAMEEGKTGMVKLQRLPLTGKLAEKMKELYGRRSEVLTGPDANKATFVKKIVPKLSQYSDIIFATHGYYGTDLPGIQQPVLFLSMVPLGVDGCLRMNEVMGLNLNADMVALTACQSGLGKHVTGEGVMGMGRAFQAAGAKSVLMSLWSVAEGFSVDMVERFFTHEKQGKNKLEALQLARKEIRDEGYEHPFFWAPFILVGEVN